MLIGTLRSCGCAAILEVALDASNLPWRLSHWNPQIEMELQVGNVEMTGWNEGRLVHRAAGAGSPLVRAEKNYY